MNKIIEGKIIPNKAGINIDQSVLNNHMLWSEEVVGRENDGEPIKTYWKSMSRTTAL